MIATGDWCDSGPVPEFAPCPVALVKWLGRAHPFVAVEPIAVASMLPFGDSNSVVVPLGHPYPVDDSWIVAPDLYSSP